MPLRGGRATKCPRAPELRWPPVATVQPSGTDIRSALPTTAAGAQVQPAISTRPGKPFSPIGIDWFRQLFGSPPVAGRAAMHSPNIEILAAQAPVARVER